MVEPAPVLKSKICAMKAVKALLLWERFFFTSEGCFSIHAASEVGSDVLQQVNLVPATKLRNLSVKIIYVKQ